MDQIDEQMEHIDEQIGHLESLASQLIEVANRLDGHDTDISELRAELEAFKSEVLAFQASSRQDRKELRELVESLNKKLDELPSKEERQAEVLAAIDTAVTRWRKKNLTLRNVSLSLGVLTSLGVLVNLIGGWLA